ncbi:cytochrome P450 [Hyaloscypha bicolor E]|uniref:Cytochrome P450 n=1 Tax=Hyaloscypha bicolor E TaxID=1095630 RepID=A0A2J6SYA8_9HELO|nr:cytochrome P450 [Hyaloscypha bicolor E]PMD55747.1 cytochrome P450 [Hyaloscypha bicolor E]
MTDMSSFRDIVPAVALAGISTVLYIVYLGFWRLYFSPISHFPGPKLAALTYWYEFYYEIPLRGQYLWKIRSLHEQYGPIVRINPHELHVSDPEFYHTLYAGPSQKRNRDPWHTDALVLDGGLLASPEQELHRNRRAALNPFFSKQSARRLLPRVQERIGTLNRRLEELKDSGKVVNVLHALSAASNDIVTEFAFGKSNNRLEDEAFDPWLSTKSLKSAAMVPLFRHFPIIPRLINSLPVLISSLIGEFDIQLRVKAKIAEQIESIRAEGTKAADKQTIFHTLLQSDLPSKEKSTARLIDEALLVVVAGSHSVAWTITVLTLHLLSSPSVLRPLKLELTRIKRAELSLPDLLSQLERLPYLTAVIKEALRLSHCVSMRLARISPDSPMQCGQWTIPAGTSVSMTSVLLHLNPDIFPYPHEFRPERWLDDPDGKLDRYMVAFSGGSRICLGFNLAWVELYIFVAGLFGSFGGRGEEWEVREVGDLGVLELWETDRRDVDVVRDQFFPVVRDESKGVRVLVHS